jgi:uncharacterized protein (DUF924 family)
MNSGPPAAGPAPAGLPAPAAEVIGFWFGGFAPAAARAEWFRKDEAFDGAIRERFGPCIDDALAGGLVHWDATPHGALARIVVLDQFTRNVFRGTPRSFDGDALALAAARAAVARGDDRRVGPVMRPFVYLPFEHAEEPAAQAESLRLFAALAAGHPEQAGLLDWARRHAEVVARFGRYPHRNAILGRPSTAEELEFLRQPGSSF